MNLPQKYWDVTIPTISAMAWSEKKSDPVTPICSPHFFSAQMPRANKQWSKMRIYPRISWFKNRMVSPWHEQNYTKRMGPPCHVQRGRSGSTIGTAVGRLSHQKTGNEVLADPEPISWWLNLFGDHPVMSWGATWWLRNKPLGSVFWE